MLPLMGFTYAQSLMGSQHSCRCLRKCQHTEGCNAVTFNPKTKNCLLKKVPLGFEKTQQSSAISYMLCPGCNRWEHDVHIEGTDLMTIEVEDHWWCLKKCQMNDGCTAAVWNAKEGKCTLKTLSADAKRMPSPGEKTFILCDRALRLRTRLFLALRLPYTCCKSTHAVCPTTVKQVVLRWSPVSQPKQHSSLCRDSKV